MAKSQRRTPSSKQQKAAAEKASDEQAALPAEEQAAPAEPAPTIHDTPPPPELGRTPTPEPTAEEVEPTPEGGAEAAADEAPSAEVPVIAKEGTGLREAAANIVNAMGYADLDEHDEHTEVRLELAGEAPSLRPRIAVFDRRTPDPEEETGWTCRARITLGSLPEWASDLCIAQMKGNLRRDLSGWLAPIKQMRKQLGFANPTDKINIPPCVSSRAIEKQMLSTGAPPNEREEIVQEIHSYQEPLGDDLFFKMAYHDQVVPERLTKEERGDVLYARTMEELRSICAQMKELVRIRRDNAQAQLDLPAGAVVNPTAQMLPEEVARRAARQDGVGIQA